jgi:hypothetical protein
MNNETIQSCKEKIGQIDKRMLELQSERFTAQMRLSLLLAQAAKDNPPVAPAMRQPDWYDQHVGGSGFEDSPQGGSR